MLSEDRAAGSRMHVLDWLDGGNFTSSVNEMIRPTGFFVPESGNRMPKGWDSTDEARFGKACGALINDVLNETLQKWWLVNVRGANVPNWDLACEALYHGDKPALVILEAKAYVREFTSGASGQRGKNVKNREQIKKAIQQACNDLSRHAAGVKISSDSWYQFSNRIAFAWKLASQGIPTALIYLGFVGDKGIGGADLLRDHNHWRETVINSTRDIFPASLWELPLDINGTSLLFLVRSLPCGRQSPLRALA